ncbi:hypothetical protein SBC1_08880 [Caballeronia sp. SBC1]|uniref:helix-turn-helix transcriptional regulator n=1 Tax=Caballeronia sp. SBC1 TaxID=2705548 RepID=UPI00140749B7|nr:helix-turn-helix domain-containing protein [Caballeronia sp. SBC1]QIN60909.1 hypothetical protein SBC1_08880 [Caballeronia sp. SBC1]
MTSALSSAGVAPEVEHFDRLPDAAHVDVGVVAAIYGISVATVKRRVKDGKLPAPHEICGMKRFKVGDLRAHVQGDRACP